jgi:hypothetical protein
MYRDGNTVAISRMDSNLYPVKKFRNVFIVLLLIYNNSETRRKSAKASRQELIIRCDIRLFSLKTELYNLSNNGISMLDTQEIRFMLHLFIFFNTNKSYRQSRYYSLHWAHTVWEDISD